MSRKHVQPFKSADDDWRKDAACHGQDPQLFDLENGKENEALVRAEFCAACPVRHECLAYGRYIKGDGIWGGVLLEDGRMRMGRPRKEAVPQ